MESPKLDRLITTYTGPKDPEVGRIGWSDDTVWLDSVAQRGTDGFARIGFRGVPEAVWNFHIGGYQVCEKWLKDRRGRTLSKDDLVHYQKVVVALAETIRLMREIDQAIEDHGGWPGAFAGGMSATPAVDGAAPLIAFRTSDPRDPQIGLHVDDGDESEAESLASDNNGTMVRQTSTGKSAEPPPSASELDSDEVICGVRQFFADGQSRDREAAIAGLASEFGFERVGSRIRETLENALRTAVRRGVLANTNEGLQLESRSVEGYDRAFLKEQLLASLEGRAWRERDEAARGFARWLGFRRTGPTINDSVRSLVNGLIREGRLESEGSLIRRTGN